MTPFYVQFFLALFATVGFCVIIRVPLRCMPGCAAVGAIGWMVYELTFYYLSSPVMGCFVGACAVGILSTIFSKLFKDASTIFTIPGILCLVPGFNIYSTMAAMLKHDLQGTFSTGLETLLMAGAIALGLLVIGATLGVIKRLIRTTISIKDYFVLK